MIRKQNQIFFTVLVASDLLMLTLAWLCAFEIRFLGQLVPVRHGVPEISIYLYMLPVILATFPISAGMSGIYKPFGKRRFPSHIFHACKTVTLIVVLSLFVSFFLREFSYSRLVAVYFWVLATAFISISHMLLWKALIKYRKKEEYLKKTLIVGNGELGQSLAEKIAFHQELGFLVVGFVSVGESTSETGRGNDFPVLGQIEDLKEIVGGHGIDQVFLAVPSKMHEKIGQAVAILSDEMVDIKVIPDFLHYMRLNAGIDEFEGMPVINLVAGSMFGWNRVLKRVFDTVFSLAALTAFAPLMLLIAVAVKVGSRGPIFYNQERMGLDGRLFTMYKFRSMRVEAEKESGPRFSERNDSRTTPLGTILRRLSLDELPQLFNVIKGEMGLVGPRPERPVFVEDFKKKIPRYMHRHKVKAGMTGWAQVNDWRGNTSIDKRIEYDLYYIEHWSPFFDLKILFYTIWKVFFSKHAY